MIKVDLITGFLGSGKTTFIKNYAKYLAETSCKVGIIENDFGSINVDVLLLSDIMNENIEVFPVTSCCSNDWMRRFKAKLITLKLQGFTRIIVEPSGVFDVSDFFDELSSDELSDKFEVGNVFFILNGSMSLDLSDDSRYTLAEEVISASKIIVNRVSSNLSNIIDYINQSIIEFGGIRDIKKDVLIKYEFKDIINSGYLSNSLIKQNFKDKFQSIYILESKITIDKLKEVSKILLKDSNIKRIKGFVYDNNKWYEINIDHTSIKIDERTDGQEVIIVICENIDKDKIMKYFND